MTALALLQLQGIHVLIDLNDCLILAQFEALAVQQMAAADMVITLGLLHMRPLQRWLKCMGLSPLLQPSASHKGYAHMS